ncbi:hypothetical protein PQX77_006522 [Marasmius sp. AFHP31]|nr:hypothetical protein PQX77_006522 [Marasmius sp. AFHP31]
MTLTSPLVAHAHHQTAEFSCRSERPLRRAIYLVPRTSRLATPRTQTSVHSATHSSGTRGPFCLSLRSTTTNASTFTKINSTSYHGYTIYNGAPTSRAPTNDPAAAQSPDPAILPHPVEPRAPLMPFNWPWAFIRSLVGAVVRAVAMSIEGRIPRDRRMNADDDDDDRFPLLSASDQRRTPGAEENV